MSYATTASPKPSFRAPWRVGDVVAGRGHAAWTSMRGYSCPCQNCSWLPPAEKTGIGSLLNRVSSPLNDPSCRSWDMNYTEVFLITWMDSSTVSENLHYASTKLLREKITVSLSILSLTYHLITSPFPHGHNTGLQALAWVKGKRMKMSTYS